MVIVDWVYGHLHVPDDLGVGLSLVIVYLTDMPELMYVITSFKVRFIITYDASSHSTNYWDIWWVLG